MKSYVDFYDLDKMDFAYTRDKFLLLPKVGIKMKKSI